MTRTPKAASAARTGPSTTDSDAAAARAPAAAAAEAAATAAEEKAKGENIISELKKDLTKVLEVLCH